MAVSIPIAVVVTVLTKVKTLDASTECSIGDEDDVVIAHLQSCGEEITARIAEVDLENDRNERPVELRHVGAKELATSRGSCR